MGLLEAKAQIEGDLTWRLDELRFLSNQLFYILDESDADRYRRCLVVMLYAHAEGFFRFAIGIYIAEVKAAELFCRDVPYPMAAATLSDAFDKLDSLDRKNKLFKRTLPEDKSIHKLYRRAEFLERIVDFLQEKADFDADDVIDPRSNLKSDIIERALYQVGLPHDALVTWHNELMRILHYRNAIAHGSKRDGIRKEELDSLRAAAEAFLKATADLVYDALRDKRYLRSTS